MQLARIFFLTRQKTYLRKVRELFLARKMEGWLTKDEIITLYINRVFLGHRAYGFQAAAQTYFNKRLSELSVAEAALLAGLPKAPSAFNPIINPERARIRRNYILTRLHDNALIDSATYAAALSEPVESRLYAPPFSVPAGHAAELARQQAANLLGEDAYRAGYTVYTTIEADAQREANAAVQRGLVDYIRRHPWAGVASFANLRGVYAAKTETEQQNQLLQLTRSVVSIDGLTRALIYEVANNTTTVFTEEGAFIALHTDDTDWAIRTFDPTLTAKKAMLVDDDVATWGSDDDVWLDPTPGRPDILKTREQRALPVGGLVYLFKQADGYRLTTPPKAQAALISLNAETGAIMSMVGGFNYQNYKFNRAVQSLRQPGSSFKPFLYAAAFNQGFTAASVINDIPISYEDPETGFMWRPQNYSGRNYGATRLRDALVYSRNLVSIRLLNDMGISPTLNFMKRFGFDDAVFADNRNLSLSLGSAPLSPLQLARGFAVFANGGFLLEPYLIDRIENADGQIVYHHQANLVCAECTQGPFAPRTLDEDIAYILNDVMREVVARGTARKARRLNRADLAGKTGTTNDQFDAWFSGFNEHIVTTLWVGFDQPQSLGARETGGGAALPIWLDYMEHVLPNTPETERAPSANIITARVGVESGKPITPNVTEESYLELFRSKYAPRVVTIEERYLDEDDEMLVNGALPLAPQNNSAAPNNNNAEPLLPPRTAPDERRAANRALQEALF